MLNIKKDFKRDIFGGGRPLIGQRIFMRNKSENHKFCPL